MKLENPNNMVSNVKLRSLNIFLLISLLSYTGCNRTVHVSNGMQRWQKKIMKESMDVDDKNKHIDSTTDWNDDARQRNLVSMFKEISKGSERWKYFRNGGRIDARIRRLKSGSTTLHVASGGGEEKILMELLGDLNNNLKLERKSYYNPYPLSDWINIENENGRTAYDLGNEKVKNILKKFGGKKGSGIGFEKNKLKGNKSYFEEKIDQLRWCFYNNDVSRGKHILKNIEEKSDYMLCLAVQGWCRKYNMSLKSKRYKRCDYVKGRDLNWNKTPVDIYGKVVHFIGSWHEIKDRRGNVIMDELKCGGEKSIQLYASIRDFGGRHSDGFIQERLLKKDFQMQGYDEYHGDLEYFFCYATGKVWEKDRVAPLWNFLKKAMKKEDEEVVRLLVSHSKVRIDNGAGEDLLHYALSVVKSIKMANILLRNGARCRDIKNYCKGCGYNTYVKVKSEKSNFEFQLR